MVCTPHPPAGHDEVIRGGEVGDGAVDGQGRAAAGSLCRGSSVFGGQGAHPCPDNSLLFSSLIPSLITGVSLSTLRDAALPRPRHPASHSPAYFKPSRAYRSERVWAGGKGEKNPGPLCTVLPWVSPEIEPAGSWPTHPLGCHFLPWISRSWGRGCYVTPTEKRGSAKKVRELWSAHTAGQMVQ